MSKNSQIEQEMTLLPGPLEGTVSVQNIVSLDDDFSSFSLDQHREHYKEEGYTIARMIVPTVSIDELVSTYRRDIRPGKSTHARFFIKKQFPTTHTEEGYLINPPKSAHKSPVQAFAQASIDVLEGDDLQQILVACNNGPIKIGESVYFERAINTGGHQDTHFSGGSPGLTAWIALEDIQPGAGRLWVQPKTHLDSYTGCGDRGRSGEYFRDLNASIDNSKIVAPALEKGDALVFSARTIHGSLVATTPQYSRNALSGLFVNQEY